MLEHSRSNRSGEHRPVRDLLLVQSDQQAWRLPTAPPPAFLEHSFPPLDRPQVSAALHGLRGCALWHGPGQRSGSRTPMGRGLRRSGDIPHPWRRGRPGRSLPIFWMIQPSPRSTDAGGRLTMRLGGRFSSRPRLGPPEPPLPPRFRSRLFMSNCAGASVLAFGCTRCFSHERFPVRAKRRWPTSRGIGRRRIQIKRRRQAARSRKPLFHIDARSTICAVRSQSAVSVVQATCVSAGT